MSAPSAAILDCLRSEVRERVRFRAGIEDSLANLRSDPAAPVLWWVHHAMRVEENPAFETALALARRLDRPVMPVAVVGGRHLYNNDRHLTFALEGLRDLQRDLRGMGLDLAVLVREPGAPSPIRALAQSAAAVVTESMPAPPWPRWIGSITDACNGRLIEVDASCLVPITKSQRSPDRAFVFRDRFAKERSVALSRPWPESDSRGVAVAAMPAGGVDLAATAIEELVAALAVDHTVGPVPESPGGTAAGLARWAQFRAAGLRRYASDRNDAARDGTSRMSPYLHYGMVSAFRLAREAAEDRAEKFLDELLIWRELAWHWSAFAADSESLAALPSWALRTLEAHRDDHRDRVCDELLERGVVEVPLWDLAQRSLLRHGELHNNLRMTWGKAIPLWSASPEEAVRRLFELNHRYALDGCDPSSAGGLLWCLGLFDRPFEPEQPVMGTIRGRGVAEHEGRVDLARLKRRIDRLERRGQSGDALRVAVIGAGVCGLVAARTLHDHGVEVEVFDKGRGPGGRISTRRGGECRYDHGAPAFSVTDERFRRMVTGWSDLGVIAAGSPRVLDASAGKVEPGAEERWVGTSGMNSLAKHLARDLPVNFGRAVSGICPSPGAGAWELHGEEIASGGFDAVLLTVPPMQARSLLAACGEQLRSERCDLEESLGAVEMIPSWVAMVELEAPWNPQAEVIRWTEASPIVEAVWQGAKPGRSEADRAAWVAIASPRWTERHLEYERGDAESLLAAAWRDQIGGGWAGGEVPGIRSITAHRWRYAHAAGGSWQSPWWSDHLALGVGGDWSHPGSCGVERAALAGAALAGRVLGCRRFAVGPQESAAASSQASLFE